MGQCLAADPAQGPRACDATDYGCPGIRGGNLSFPTKSDFASYEEAWYYLTNLNRDYDSGGYMELLGIGESVSLQGYCPTDPDDVPYQVVGSGSLLVTRITVDAEYPDTERPRILFVCGEHAFEWLPQETCLGLVDWLVQAANGTDYEDDHEVVVAMLEKAEVWVLTHANPAGRMLDEGLGGSGVPGSQGYFNQQKNHQWSTDREYPQDWDQEAHSGRCYAVDTPGPYFWEKSGINLNDNYSQGWGSARDEAYGRNLIVGDPDKAELATARAAEEWPCSDNDPNTDDNPKCAAAFPSHTNCVEYLDADGNSVSGCFLWPAKATQQECAGIFSISGVSSFPDEYGLGHAACLETPVPGGNAWLIWECGQDGSARDANTFYCVGLGAGFCPPLADTGPLLRYCDRGVLVSCNNSLPDDAACQLLQASIANPTEDLPQEMDPATADHLYCGKNGYCAIDSKQTFCAPDYRGSHAFEAIEARAVRELVNNVSFSMVVAAHSAEGILAYICSSQKGGCSSGNRAADNGAGMLAEMQVAYDSAAEASWTALYGGTQEDATMQMGSALPRFLRLGAGSGSAAGQGQTTAWMASMPTTQTFHGAAIPASLANFDNDTLRAIPTFLLELGAQEYDRVSWPEGDAGVPERQLYARLNNCNNDTDGIGSSGQPRSTLLVLNQLDGTKGMLRYMVDQAATPQAAQDGLGALLLADTVDAAIAGLVIGDAGGRGIQQSELRWERIADDLTAEIVVPAGLWDVSVELSLGATAGTTRTVPLDVHLEEMEKATDESWQPNGTPRYLARSLNVDLTAGDRQRLDFGTELEAGKIYQVIAEIKETWPVGRQSDSNNRRVAMVKVVSCGEGEGIPNGLSSDAFCRQGLPHGNPAFGCNSRNQCTECATGIDAMFDECSPRGYGGFCQQGVCDGMMACWSGRMMDTDEGGSLDGPVFDGLNTYIWDRSFYVLGGSDDVDSARFYLAPSKPLPGGYRVTVHVSDLCEPTPAMFDLLSPQMEVWLGMEIGGGAEQVLAEWTEVNADGTTKEWRRPYFSAGATAELNAAEKAAFESGKPLLMKVKKSYLQWDTDDPSTLYQPRHDQFRYLAIATVARSKQKTVDMTVFGRGALPKLEGSSSFVLRSAIHDPVVYSTEVSAAALERGDRVYLHFDDGGVPDTVDLAIVDSKGAVVAEAAEELEGLVVDLGTLDPAGGPYTVKALQADGGPMGRLYLCPAWSEDCASYEPADMACLGGCGFGKACCLDEDADVTGCVDVQGNPANCGACGRECAAGETCQKGVCVDVDGPYFWDVTCPARMWPCPGKTWWAKDVTCKALLADNGNCGWCGFKCPANMTCSNGLCVPKCGTGCNKECADGRSCCWVLGVKKCFDLFRNPLNCGACGNKCGCGEICDQGRCRPWTEVYDPCPAGTRNCGGERVRCLNVQSDPANCGSCGFACPDGVGCENGLCVDRRELPALSEEESHARR